MKRSSKSVLLSKSPNDDLYKLRKNCRSFISKTQSQIRSLLKGDRQEAILIRQRLQKVSNEWPRLCELDSSVGEKHVSRLYFQMLTDLSQRLEDVLQPEVAEDEEEEEKEKEKESSSQELSKKSSPKNAISIPLNYKIRLIRSTKDGQKTGNDELLKKSSLSSPFTCCSSSSTSSSSTSSSSLSSSSLGDIVSTKSVVYSDYFTTKDILLGSFQQKYDGNELLWHKFCTQFRSLVIKNPRLTDDQRLSLLLQCTDGCAHNLINGFPLGQNLFEKAFQVLTFALDHRKPAYQNLLEPLKNFKPILFDNDWYGLDCLWMTLNEVIMKLKFAQVPDWVFDAFVLPMVVDRVPRSLFSQRFIDSELNLLSFMDNLKQILSNKS